MEPGAPCEINIDGKTMEKVQHGLKAPSRFTFDVAAEHVYTLLLKKDCYPRFIRSDHYKALLANAIQPSQKKRFFGFGGPAKKKASTTVAPNPSLLSQVTNRKFMRRRQITVKAFPNATEPMLKLFIPTDPRRSSHFIARKTTRQ